MSEQRLNGGGLTTRSLSRTLARTNNAENPYDFNAIRVENVFGQKIGHIERDVAALLSPLLDAKACAAEGYVSNGAKNRYQVG